MNVTNFFYNISMATCFDLARSSLFFMARCTTEYI